MKQIEPVGNMVLVEYIDSAIARAKKKMFVPDTVKTPECATWIVRDVGPGRVLNDGRKLPIPLKAGDHVLFPAPHAFVLAPPSAFDDRKLALVDADVVICKVWETPTPPAGTKPLLQ